MQVWLDMKSKISPVSFADLSIWSILIYEVMHGYWLEIMAPCKWFIWLYIVQNFLSTSNAKEQRFNSAEYLSSSTKLPISLPHALALQVYLNLLLQVSSVVCLLDFKTIFDGAWYAVCYYWLIQHKKLKQHVAKSSKTKRDQNNVMDPNHLPQKAQLGNHFWPFIMFHINYFPVKRQYREIVVGVGNPSIVKVLNQIPLQ